MGIVKCPNCGLKVSDDTGECFACGHKLNRPVSQEQEATQHTSEMIEYTQSFITPIRDYNVNMSSQIEIPNHVQDTHTAPFDSAIATNNTIVKGGKTEVNKTEVSKDDSISPIRIILMVLSVLTIIVSLAIGWYYGIKIPKDNAYAAYLDSLNTANKTILQYNDEVMSYNDRVTEIKTANDSFEDSIQNAQALIDTGEIPYEEDKKTSLSNSIEDARNSEVVLPEFIETAEELPVDDALTKARKTEIESATALALATTDEYNKKIESVISQTEELIIPDYSSLVDELTVKSKELEDSYAIQAQITEPAQEWVMTRLGRVNDIAKMAAVTENHDPNGNLNKAGGYTATVYFSTPLLDTQDLSGYDVIEKGTDGGGAIEVYRSIEDAKKRDDYLAAFDGGGIIASGSHMVLGTMVIRTSDDLKASQQETLTNDIIKEMIALD